MDCESWIKQLAGTWHLLQSLSLRAQRSNLKAVFLRLPRRSPKNGETPRNDKKSLVLQIRDCFVAPWSLLAMTIALCFFSTSLANAKIAEAAGGMPPGLTRCIKSTCVPTLQAIGSQAIPLTGLELFQYWGFNLYTAALYAPAGTDTSAKVLADIPKSLILHYHRKIRADQIIKAAEHNLAKNPANDMRALRSSIDALHTAFVSVNKDDTYELRYEPTKGTTLLFNGEPKTTVPGTDFQRAYFGVWLSDYSLNSKLRDALLNSNNP